MGFFFEWQKCGLTCSFVIHRAEILSGHMIIVPPYNVCNSSEVQYYAAVFTSIYTFNVASHMPDLTGRLKNNHKDIFEKIYVPKTNLTDFLFLLLLRVIFCG